MNADGDSEVAAQSENKPTDINENQKVQTPIKMTSENNADALQTIGGPPRSSAVTTLDQNSSGNGGVGSSSQNSNIKNNQSTNGVNNNVGGSLNNINSGNLRKSQESEDEEEEEGFVSAAGNNPSNPGRAGGFWGGGAGVGAGQFSRAASPSMMDNMSEISSQAPGPPTQIVRSKSRNDMISGTAGPIQPGPSSRYSNALSFWKARCVTLYRNGDPFFGGMDFRFKPGRDIGTLEAFLDKITQRMDLPRGARYIFSMDGDRKYNLDELEDGSSYVVSSYKAFKVSWSFYSRGNVYKINM